MKLRVFKIEEVCSSEQIRHDDECDHGKEGVEHHETSHGLPDPSPPRVGAHADKDGEEGHEAESDGEMGQVSRAGPLDTKKAVLLLAPVANTLGEVTTLEVGVHGLPIARPVWYPQHLAFTPFHEAIFSDGSAVQKLSPIVQEPVGAGDSKDIEKQADGDEEKGDSVRGFPHRGEVSGQDLHALSRQLGLMRDVSRADYPNMGLFATMQHHTVQYPLDH